MSLETNGLLAQPSPTEVLITAQHDVVARRSTSMTEISYQRTSRSPELTFPMPRLKQTYLDGLPEKFQVAVKREYRAYFGSNSTHQTTVCPRHRAHDQSRYLCQLFTLCSFAKHPLGQELHLRQLVS